MSSHTFDVTFTDDFLQLASGLYYYCYCGLIKYVQFCSMELSFADLRSGTLVN